MSPKKLIHRARINDIGGVFLDKSPNVVIHYVKLTDDVAGMIFSAYRDTKDIHFIQIAKIVDKHCKIMTDWRNDKNRYFDSYIDALTCLEDTSKQYLN